MQTRANNYEKMTETEEINVLHTFLVFSRQLSLLTAPVRSKFCPLYFILQ